MISRQRKRRREEAFHYARAYLNVKRLPKGVPDFIRGWAASLSEDDVRWGADPRGLAYGLKPFYRRNWMLP